MILIFSWLSFGLAMYGETNNDHGYPQIGNHPQGWDSREQTKEYWTKVGNDELKKGRSRVMLKELPQTISTIPTILSSGVE